MHRTKKIPISFLLRVAICKLEPGSGQTLLFKFKCEASQLKTNPLKAKVIKFGQVTIHPSYTHGPRHCFSFLQEAMIFVALRQQDLRSLPGSLDPRPILTSASSPRYNVIWKRLWLWWGFFQPKLIFCLDLRCIELMIWMWDKGYGIGWVYVIYSDFFNYFQVTVSLVVSMLLIGRYLFYTYIL